MHAGLISGVLSNKPIYCRLLTVTKAPASLVLIKHSEGFRTVFRIHFMDNTAKGRTQEISTRVLRSLSHIRMRGVESVQHTTEDVAYG